MTDPQMHPSLLMSQYIQFQFHFTTAPILLIAAKKFANANLKKELSAIAAFAAYRSASHELNATVACVLLKLEIYAPFTNMTHELVDLLVGRSFPHDESEKISRT